ncbi:3,4-dihydroxy-2-butanone-4-phosphate synthase [Streptomyces sp. NPDC020362]|uniref:3,4-dihydroxy-2-butanone-4-phosphate synthase n=1 Tax=unclassified Streptomyces TaxID=2593676 RepID=UPI000AFBFA42
MTNYDEGVVERVTKTAMCDIEDAIAAIARGEMIVVLDDEDRENEGDLIVAADHATPEVINFMITHGRGLVCVAITSERAIELELPPMVARNQDHHGTAFTVSVDGAPAHGVTTGISAFDRAKSIELLLHGQASDLRRPGHIFPLVAQPGGVLERNGHTEAGVDFARLAGLTPAGVLVEIINADGSMARRDELEAFAREHGLVITTIERLQQYRMAADVVTGASRS